MANNTLRPQQHRAIASLLSEPTIKQAAAAAGVGERTLHAWLDEPAFDAAYRLAKRKAVAQAVSRLQQYSVSAVGVMLTLMADSKTKPALRLQAADKILAYAIRAIEIEDLSARLAILEQAHVQKP